MMNVLVRRLWLSAWFVGVLVMPAQAEVIVGLTPTNNLVFFRSNAPGTMLLTLPITGLQPAESVLAIDFRPSTGQLYGLGSTSRLYTIDTATGVAAPVGSGPFSPALSGTSFGFDFNPATDLIRVVSDANQNLRLNANTGAVIAADLLLAYAPGDPNAGMPPGILGLAYTSNFAGATRTTAYGIDAVLGILVRLGSPGGSPISPNAGQLFTVGSLGVIPSSQQIGFDISPVGGRAFAALETGGGLSRLYTVQLEDGVAALVGTVAAGAPLRDIAVAAFQRFLVTGTGVGGGPHVQVFDAATGTLRFSFFPFDPGLTSGVRVASCDVNGDGFPDIVVGAGPGGGPHVRVFDGVTGAQLTDPIGSFFAYNPGFIGGVFVGCLPNRVIVGAGAGGGPHVQVLDLTATQIAGPLGSFFPYNAGYTGGVFVSGGAP